MARLSWLRADAASGRLARIGRSVALFLAILGPGLITATADNDSGGIATYSLAGAQYGYSLLWTLIPITVLLMLTLEMTARIGVVTHKGLADLVREEFGVKSTAGLLFLVLLANIGTAASEFAGIASAVGIVGGYAGLRITWLGKALIPAFVFVIWVLVVKADYKRLEKVFLVLVLFYVSYIVAAFAAKPDWGAAARGLVVPTFINEPNYIFSMVGVIGTTITPWMYFYLQGTVVEKGITEEDYRYARWDVLISCITTNVVAFFIIVACAATLWVAKVDVKSIDEVGQALVPFARGYASVLFATGLFGASVFGAVILPISTSFTICEAMGWEHGLNRRYSEAPAFYGIFTFILVVGAVIILIPGAPLLFMMRLSQVAQGIVLPFFLFFLIRLASSPRLMGHHANARWLNAVSWAGAVVLALMSIYLLVSPLVALR
jgi:NRAMP (natural resistance-associated macrophage protein)-like metal ion transporter